jgi:NAD(P)-dependent dehydrogenase (short-subunit alcohol dehydrogenase family)
MPDTASCAAQRPLSGRSAIVTGASSGIGRAIALRLAAAGADVAACGLDARRAAATAAQARRRHGVRTCALTGDVSDEEDAQRLVESAAGTFGAADVLVNCAGIDVTDGWSPVHDTPVATWDRVLAVNLRGAFLMSKFAIREMLKGSGGTILHVSSVAAVTVWPGDCAYDVSKAGLNMLSNHIAVEYGASGIRSNTLMPGMVRTPMYDALLADNPDRGRIESDLVARHPVGRLGTVSEIAEAALFLCVPGMGFMTGSAVLVDGGYSRV